MSKSISLEDYVLQLMALQPGKFTVHHLVSGSTDHPGGTGQPASRIRKVLGFLYGRGFVCVESVVDGQEVWRLTKPEERLKT